MKTNRWILLVLLVNLLLRLPSLFDPVSYGDECIYLTLGQALRKGLVFYRDIHDNKPPLLYLAAALAGGKQVWFRLLTIGWTTVNTYLIFLIARKLFGRPKSAIWAALLFVILSYLPEGRIPNGENYMIMPFTLGVWLILRYHRWFWAGVAMSVGFLFKVPVGFDFVAICLAFFVFSSKGIGQLVTQLKKKDPYLLVAGFLIPIIVSILYYWSKGAFTPYVRSALMQNIGYLSSWSGQEGTGFIARNRGLVVRGLLLLFITAGLYWRRFRLGSPFVWLAMWCAWALFGALLSERPYPHYLIEVVPALSLLLVAVWKGFRPEKMIVSMVLLLLIGFSFFYYRFWWYPNLPYFRNFFRFVLGQIDMREYRNFFGQKTITDYLVSAYLKTHTNPDERVFVWGDGACIYALSERLPPGRYTVNYHIFDFNGFSETKEAIDRHHPNMIVKLSSETRDFPQLDALLTNRYLKLKTIYEADIYNRID